MSELAFTPLLNDANLFSYYRMEGNSNDSKNAHNGTDTSITYAAANGRYGQGALFNGTTSKIDFGNVFDQTTGSFSVAFWIKPSAGTGNDQGIIDKSTSADAGFIIHKDTLPAVKFQGFASGGGSLWVITTSSLSTSTYSHIACVADRTGNNAYIYVNGVQNVTGGIAAGSITNTATLRMGVDRSNTVFAAMSLDEVALFNNKILSPTEVKELFYDMAGFYGQL